MEKEIVITVDPKTGNIDMKVKSLSQYEIIGLFESLKAQIIKNMASEERKSKS